MKKFIYIVALLCTTTLCKAQQDSKTVVRDVLFIRHFSGEFRLPKASETTLNIGQAMDAITFAIVPYNKRPDGGYWPFESYMFELWRNPYVYHFNEIFVSNYTFKEEYKKFIKASGNKISFVDVAAHIPNTGIYILGKQKGILANIWLIKAEWEQITVKEKPDFIKGQMPGILTFDDYDIFILRKILKASVVDSSDIQEDRLWIEFRKDIPFHPLYSFSVQ